MFDGSRQDASVPPPRPPRRGGLALWLSLVVGVTAGVVLLANDGRNLALVRHRLGMEDGAGATYPPKQDLSAPQAPSSRLWPLRLPFVSAHDVLVGFRPPEQRCLDLAVTGQEPPQFIRETGGAWQCVMFWAASQESDAPSVFVQIRGDAHGDIIAWRAKFSKSGSDGAEIASRGLQLLRAALQPLSLSEEVFSTLYEKISTWQAFSFYIGNQSLSFRHEFNDPSRFNLLAQQAKIRAYVPPPISALRQRSAGDVKGSGTPVSKSGRLDQMR